MADQEDNSSSSNEACWSASTNWIVTEGSLQDSVSFDTSTTPDPDPTTDDSSSKHPLILTPPPPSSDQDPPPCDITIRFREKHEIHRVYIRSTARIYEIYYASEHNNDEYLCTVRCGAANEEAILSEQVVRSDSNTSDEDGWVQVKIPGEIASPKTQICYEATAEISDSSPCVSVTLRLLSIQTKASVHVEEIYIYADPVESATPDSAVNMGEDLGKSSLLAMLVPSLMQLSKSRASTMQDRCLPNESRSVPNDQSNLGRTVPQEAYSCVFPDKKLGPVEETSEVKPGKAQFESSQKVTHPEEVPKSPIGENEHLAYSRVEKVLDKLVSRVERVEAFCSRFEENIMKPLSCIDMRLQRLEQQLDAFAVGSQPSGRFPCSRISAPEYLSDDSDSENKDCNTKTATREGAMSDSSSPANEVELSVPESQLHPTLVIKAPEFPNEEDECTDSVDTLDCLVKEDLPKNVKSTSIDDALASALSAFLTSTTVKSPKSTPNLIHSQQPSNCNISDLDLSIVTVPSEGGDSLFNKPVLEEKATFFGNSSLLSDDAASPSPDSKICESDGKNMGSGTSNVVKEGTVFDAPHLVADDDEAPPAFAPSLVTGLRVVVPEFLNEDGSISCDDTPNSPVRDVLKDRASLNGDGYKISSLSNDDSNELAALPADVTIGEVDESDVMIHEENQKKSKIDLDPNQSLLSPKVNLEIKDHDNSNCKYNTVNMEAPSGGATPECMLREGILGQKDHAAPKCSERLSSETTSEGFFVQNLLLHYIGARSIGCANQDCHGGSLTDDNDAEESVTQDLNPLGRGWVEDSSTSSDYNDNSIKDKADIGRSDVGRSGFSEGAFTAIGHDKGQCAGSPVAVDNKDLLDTDFTTGAYQSTAGGSQESSNREMKQASSTVQGDNDIIFNVSFAQEKNWVTDLPLEMLLGEMPGTSVHKAAAKGDGDDNIAAGQEQDNSPASQLIERKVEAPGGLLLDAEDLSLLIEVSSLGNEEGPLQGFASSLI